MNVYDYPQGQAAQGRKAAPRFSAPGLALLLLMASLGSARAQTALPVSPPHLSFRSLPALGLTYGGGGLRQVSVFPVSSRIPQELLWQAPALSEGAASPSALADAAQAIQAAVQKSLASLKTGDAAGYVAILAPDYVPSGPSGPTQSKADVLRAAQAELTNHRYTDADFQITDLRLVTPTEAAVTMTQRTVTVTTDTPPTVYKMPNGSSYVQSNTVTVRRDTVFHQAWAKRGADWVLVRSQAVDGVTTAVA